MDTAFMASRRSMLTGTFGAIGAVAVASPLAATSITARPWDAALARYRSAKLAADSYRASHYDPAWRRIDTASGPRQAKAIIRAPGLPPREITVEQSARYPVGAEYDDARHIQLELREWWDRRTVAEDENVHITRRQESLWAEEDAARSALMAEPAPDAAALATKMLFAFEEDEIWDHERKALVADANRLLPKNFQMGLA